MTGTGLDLFGNPLPKRTRKKVETTHLGKREVCPRGWNDNLVLEKISREGRDEWLSMNELARFAWRRDSEDNRRNARTRVSGLFRRQLASEGFLLSLEYEVVPGKRKQRRIMAVKVYDKANLEERQLLQAKLEWLIRRKEITQRMYEHGLRQGEL